MENSSITTAQIANLLGISRQAVAKQVRRLREDGVIHREGPDNGGRWKVEL